MFRHQEFAFVMVELAKIFQPHTYVEIGVQKSYTFNKLSPLVKRAVAVDIVPPRNLDAWKHVETYVMSSLEFAQQWKDPIDFLFIDADHRKKSLLADFEALSPFVRDSGFIMLHDTHPVNEGLLSDGYCSDAFMAAWEIFKTKPEFQIFTFPGPWAGLSLVRKTTKPLHWMNDEQLSRYLPEPVFQAETQTEMEGSFDGGGYTENPEPEKRSGRRVRHGGSRK